MIESNFTQDISALKKLPNSWSVIDFGEVFTDISGGNKKFLKSDFLLEGKVAVVDQGKDLIAGYTNEEDEVVKGQPPYIVFGDHTRIFKFIDFPFVMGADGTKVFKVKDITINDEKYLFHLLNSLNMPNTGYNRHFKYLKSTKLPLPPLPQQQKIASILDAADALRQNDKALIAKYDELTQALFLEMFGDLVTNPKGWEITTIGALFKVKGGKRLPKGSCYSTTTTEHAYLRVTDFIRNGINSEDIKFISNDIYEKISRYTISSNEVYISIAGTIGIAGYIPTNLDGANLTENAAKFCPLKGTVVMKEYLSFYLNSSFSQENIKSKTMAVGVPKLAIFRIEELPYINSPLEIQKQFVDRITLIEKQKQQAEASLVKAEELFNSLLQRAFKGELTN